MVGGGESFRVGFMNQEVWKLGTYLCTHVTDQRVVWLGELGNTLQISRSCGLRRKGPLVSLEGLEFSSEAILEFETQMIII